MKSGIHPENYRPVAFKDMSNGDTFISRSTVNTKETIDIDGYQFKVAMADSRRIIQVHVRMPDDSPVPKLDE